MATFGLRLHPIGDARGLGVSDRAFMHQYQQLAVWRRSMALAAALQGEARNVKAFIDRSAWNQITRAATSVPANIAEGAMRSSPRDFANFLSIAIGSAAELHALLLIAAESGLIAAARARADADEALQLRRMLVSLRARVTGARRPPSTG